MSKYISEDILLEDLWDSKCESDILRRVRQAIVDEISGIEGIDIVRCAECKYWKESQYYPEVMACTYVKGATFTRQHDDFCSRGEKEGE